MKSIRVFSFLFLSFFLLQHTTAQDGVKKPSNVSEDEIKANAEAFANAYKYLLLENIEQARKAFEVIVSSYKWDAASRYELARIYATENKIPEATGLAEEAYGLDKENKWYGEFLATLYEQTNQNDKLIQLLDERLKRHPDNIEALERMAEVSLSNNQPSKAVSFFNRIEEISGVNESLSLRKHKIYSETLNKKKEAAKELIALAKAFPEENRYVVMLAEYYAKIGEYDDALRIYQDLMKKNPDEVYTAISLADLYFKKGDRQKMFEILKVAFSSEKLASEPKLQVFLTLYSPEQIYNVEKRQALDLVNTMVAASPMDPKLLAIKGELLYKFDSIAEAGKVLRKSLAIDSSRYFVWEQLLFVLSSSNDTIDLEAYSSRCRSLYPFQPIPFYFDGLMKARKGQVKEAVKLFEEGKTLSSSNAALSEQFAMFLGDFYHQLNEPAKSDSAYEEALRYNPDNIYVLNNYAYYLAVRGMSLERAERLSSKTIVSEPNNPTYLDTYAWVLYKLGRYDESWYWMEKTLAADEHPSATLYDHAGDILFKLNRIEEAVDMWKKAYELDQQDDQIKLKIERRKSND